MHQPMKLLAIAKLLTEHKLDLGNALEITFGFDPEDLVVLHCWSWTDMTPEQRREIKWVFGPLEIEGSNGYKQLVGEAVVDGQRIKLVLFGSIACKIKSSTSVEVELDDYDRKSAAEQLAELSAKVRSGKRTKVEYEYDCEILGEDSE